jgi:diguanylate cyclase (GGDEF)-like protein
LLSAFSLLSVISVVCILVLAGFGIKRVFSIEMIRAAEETAVYVGNSIFEQEREVLLKPGHGRAGVALDQEDFGALDARMKRFLQTFNMYKIKAFGQDGTIIYSTDHSIIGKAEGANAKLRRVLDAGAVVSELEFKDQVRDLKGEERFKLDVVESYVPIRDGGNIVGAFEVYVDTTSTRDRVIGAMKGSLTILALVLILVFGLLYLPMRKGVHDLTRAQDELQKLASTDALTGLYNRRHVLDRVQQERARMLREKQDVAQKTMAFAMVDIDFFKKINDTYGHQVGDHVLQEVSTRLRQSLRVYDVLGRYGGEEFLVVLPNTTVHEAQFVAERMHEAVRHAPVACDGESIVVTVSIGVAATHSAAEEAAHTIKRADDALYHAKENGRDRVISSNVPPAENTDAAGLKLVS